MRIAARKSPAGAELVAIEGDRLSRLPAPPGAGGDDFAAAVRRLGALRDWPVPGAEAWQEADGAEFGPPVRPRVIIGIGLNFLPHAADLQARPTELPTLFFKGLHTIIGPGDVIPLPAMSERVTAEAELGLVIGRQMYRVSPAEALDYVAGGCCVLDQTAEDILQKDSRLLTVAKNFPGFFAFGPELASLDELAPTPAALRGLRVSTYLNGTCERTATVADMRFGPADLLSFISQLMPLECGDIVSTGTPGAVVLAPGDVVECRVSGLRPLTSVVGPPSA